MDRSTPGGLGTAPEGRRHKNQQDAGNARCSRGARSSCRPRPCACARPRAASSASRASSCSSRSRPCRRPPARPTTRSPCACSCLTRRRREGGPRLGRGLSRRLDRRLRGLVRATEHRSKSSSVAAMAWSGLDRRLRGRPRDRAQKGKAGRGKSASRSRASGSGRPRRTWPRSGRAPGRPRGRGSKAAAAR